MRTMRSYAQGTLALAATLTLVAAGCHRSARPAPSQGGSEQILRLFTLLPPDTVGVLRVDVAHASITPFRSSALSIVSQLSPHPADREVNFSRVAESIDSAVVVLPWAEDRQEPRADVMLLLFGRLRREQLEVAFATPSWTEEERQGRRLLVTGELAAGDLGEGDWVIGRPERVVQLLERREQPGGRSTPSQTALAAMAEQIHFTDAPGALLLAATPALRQSFTAATPAEARPAETWLFDAFDRAAIWVELDQEVSLRSIWQTASPPAAIAFAEQLQEWLDGVGSLLLPVGASARVSVDVQDSAVRAVARLDDSVARHALSQLVEGERWSDRRAPVLPGWSDGPPSQVPLLPLDGPPEIGQIVLCRWRSSPYFFLGRVESQQDELYHIRHLDGDDNWVRIDDIRQDTVRAGSVIHVHVDSEGDGGWLPAEVVLREDERVRVLVGGRMTWVTLGQIRVEEAR